MKVGLGSVVSYLPSADERDRRKLRRQLRNLLELFFVQKYFSKKVPPMGIVEVFSELKKQGFLGKIKNALFPPKITSLFSVWNYLNLHNQSNGSRSMSGESVTRVLWNY